MSHDVISQFGGIRPLARALGHRTHTTVQGWWLRGSIPARQQAYVLAAARSSGIPIRAEDLIAGVEG